MAVEARHLSLFPQQFVGIREIMMNGNGNGNLFAAPMSYGLVAPLSGTTTVTETVLPMYGSSLTDTFPVKTAAMRSDSGLTYAVPTSRKRSREAIDIPMLSSLPNNVTQNQNANNRCGSYTFLGEDISFQIQQQQMEIDRFIAQHTEKVRCEIEERRSRFSRRIAAAIEENIMKKLKSKEEEIEKIGKFNYALEERVKSLCMENNIWRDLAQTNEATANALRSDLEQVLAQVINEQQQAPIDDDAESCCGSNFEEFIDRRRTLEQGVKSSKPNNHSMNKMCRSCGKEESCVLLLPCRHLCLCTVCGSSLHTCPVCNSTNTATLHVNLSS